MSQSVQSPENQSTEPPSDLPPVEPPSAGFIVQLFLIPGLIVGIIVLVYLLFGRIAGSQRNPEEYLSDLRSSNEERRWCAAREVASILPHDESWQSNESFAAGLAGELESRLSKGAASEMDLQFQKYLAMALGEFKSSVGVATLCQIIQGEADRELRAAAILSLGRLGDRLGGLSDAAALPSLVAATRDGDPLMREMAALTLGSIGQPEAVQALEPMLNDADREVRYNAANAVALLGSPTSLETLREMLDIERLRTIGLSEAQLVVVPVSALRSLQQLLAKTPQADLESLRPSIASLTGTGTTRVQTTARGLLIELDSRRAKREQATGN